MWDNALDIDLLVKITKRLDTATATGHGHLRQVGQRHAGPVQTGLGQAGPGQAGQGQGKGRQGKGGPRAGRQGKGRKGRHTGKGRESSAAFSKGPRP